MSFNMHVLRQRKKNVPALFLRNHLHTLYDTKAMNCRIRKKISTVLAVPLLKKDNIKKSPTCTFLSIFWLNFVKICQFYLRY